MIKFTIITCTYNAETVLERTLESVREQSYPHIEHLIIDGNSKDGTMTMVDDYIAECEESHSQHIVKAISERDNGLYDAMNKGIKMAAGDYLIFLNAGDKLREPGTLEAVVASLNEPKEAVGVIYGDTDIVDDEGHFLHKRRLSPPEKLTWKSFKEGMLVCHQSFYARADIAKSNLYSMEYRISADVDWCIRIMKEADVKGLKLHNSHLILTSYLDGGMSIKNHRASLLERFRIMSRHYGWLTTVGMHLWFVVRALMK